MMRISIGKLVWRRSYSTQHKANIEQQAVVSSNQISDLRALHSYSLINEGAKDRQLAANKVASMKQELAQLINQNQSMREWMRNNSANNGSMSPQEHVKKLPYGIGMINIFAGRNNTICTLSDWNRKIVAPSVTGGLVGLKGALRGSVECGTRVGARIGSIAVERGFRDVWITFKGFGSGREAAFRSIIASGLKINKIIDKTPIRHGGTKPKKMRRV
ncbi:hypothetical protein MIR68_000086 [Amoeboaphelidium protococcarum]|nr:hypothetical protein MIR68_000086 [Amoeboaphelidium protococcarum]